MTWLFRLARHTITIINKLYAIIKRLYIAVNNLYIIIPTKKSNFVNSFKIDMKLNENLRE